MDIRFGLGDLSGMSVSLSPMWRKIVYAVSFELIGILVAGIGLMIMSDSSAEQSLILSALAATVALVWSYAFNTLFEAWEARQATRGRSWGRRVVHAILFEGGLILALLPLMAWWLNVTLLQAAIYEAGLIVIFTVYTFVFTWAFDRIFGLPQSAL